MALRNLCARTAPAALLAVCALAWPIAADAALGSTPRPDCQSSFDPYDYTPTALATCGIATAPAVVTDLPGGGQLYTYSDANGLIEETAMPPAGFDPATATAAQLHEYQYPTRPTDPAAQQGWLEMVSIPRQTPEPFIPVYSSGYSAVPSSHWSGYVSSDGGFTYAEGQYTEPTYDTTKCSGSAAVTWTGLGGYVGSNALAQDGTSHNTQLANHQPWWQLLPTFKTIEPFPQNGTSYPGHDIVAIVDTQSDPGNVEFDVYDYTSGTTWQTTKPLNGVDPSADAEVIAERPGKVGGGYPQLSDFQTFSVVYAAAAQNGIAYPLSRYSPTQINMYANQNGSGDLLANVGSLSDGFADFWDNCS